MAKKNRNTLKNYFRNGSVPSQDQFGDLIDSTLNIIDEGFDKTLADGLKVSQFGDTGKLMSFYKDSLVNNPLYYLNLDQGDNLTFRCGDQGNILLLPMPTESTERLRVGINTDLPENELHVDGVIRSEGRIGVASKVDSKELEVPADGVRMRTESQLIEFFGAFPSDPGGDEVIAEDVSFREELVVLFQGLQRFVK